MPVRSSPTLRCHPWTRPWLGLLLGLVLMACGPEPVPVDSIATTTSYQNPTLLAQAWRQPVATTYQPRFEYQSNGAFCGPATVVNLFRSLGIDRYTQDTLFDRAPVGYWKARILGLTLDEMAQLIRANADLEVTVLRDLTLEEFRTHLHRANDPSFRYLINFNRQPLFGVAIGHHSPLGGYLPEADLVFVLDVLDQYKPFLAPAARLYAAMDTVDPETGQKRGLLLVRAATSPVGVPSAAAPPPPARTDVPARAEPVERERVTP